MKSRMFFSFIAAVAPFFGIAQTDDMYFVPRKETKEQKERHVDAQPAVRTVPRTEASMPEEYAGGSSRDVDEYNRRYKWNNDSITAEGGDAGEEDVQDSEGDYSCSRRIIRFNAPVIGVAVSSPLYWDLHYGPASIYWDVYDDGFYAYASPAGWYWGASFSWGYHPFWWGWHGAWYAGWHSPWYWGAHWHHPHWGHPGAGWHSPRPVVRPSVRYREGSLLARGASRAAARNRYSTGRAVQSATGNVRRGTSGSAARSSASRSSSVTRQAARSRASSSTARSVTRPVRSSGTTRSVSRSTFRPSISSHGRSGGGFSPSRGGGARGGRR